MAYIYCCFHQRIFQYIENCHVPENGKEGGWDVIFRNPKGIYLPDGDVVHTVYVEMKNKHNTMNSASAYDCQSESEPQWLSFRLAFIISRKNIYKNAESAFG